MNWLVHALHRTIAVFEGSILYKLLTAAGMFSVVVATAQWFLEQDERVADRHNTAWTLIYLTAGKPGNGGRIEALQELNGHGVSLAGVPLDGASLRGVRLHEADLTRASLVETDASFADLRGATLIKADLARTKFYGANLAGADFRQSILAGTDFVCANLRDAEFGRPALAGADLCHTVMPDGARSDRDCAKTETGAGACPDRAKW